jgi:hypothetical protein
MQYSHRKSIIRLVSFIAYASNGLFEALLIAASFEVMAIKFGMEYHGSSISN